jgi:hypothetical protein
LVQKWHIMAGKSRASHERPSRDGGWMERWREGLEGGVEEWVRGAAVMEKLVVMRHKVRVGASVQGRLAIGSRNAQSGGEWVA